MPKRSKYEQVKSVIDFKNEIERRMKQEGENFNGLTVREFLEDQGFYTPKLSRAVGIEISESGLFYNVMKWRKGYGQINHWFLKE